MGLSCIVAGCLNRQQTSNFGGSFHRFPSNPLHLKNWLETLRRQRDDEFWIPKKNSRICSDHFVPEDFKRPPKEGCPSVLRKTAVPFLISRVYQSHASGCKVDRKHENTTDHKLSHSTESANIDKVLKIHRPCNDEEVAMLVKEYLHLYKAVLDLKELARIDVDSIYLCMESDKIPEIKEEMDKVQELIHTLMNGIEVYKVVLLDLEKKAPEPEEDTRGSDKQQTMLDGRNGDSPKGHGNSATAGYDESEAERLMSDDLLQHEETDLGCASDEQETSSISDDSSTKKTRHDALNFNENVENLLRLREEAKGQVTSLVSDCSLSHEQERQETEGDHRIQSLEHKVFICKHCGREYKYACSLKKHLKVHKKWDHQTLIGKSKAGSICGIKLKKKSSLLKHMKFHEESGKNDHPRKKCEVRAEELSLKDDLNAHKKCLPKKKFVCEICRKVFAREIAYESHKRMVHVGAMRCKTLTQLLVGKNVNNP